MDEIGEDIIKRAIDGDELAFEEIYKAYFGFVSSVAYRIVSKSEEAEEVCQEVFMTIYRKMSSFRQESSLKTWVYRITINHALKYAKKKSKESKGMVEYDEEGSIASLTKDARQKMDDEQNEKQVEKLLGYLNLEQRACIILRSIEGLSYQEIASTLKIPINTVRSRIKRARESMLAFRKGAMTYGQV